MEMAAEPHRLGGLSDSEVTKRYTALATALGRLEDPGGGRTLEQLEADPSDLEFPSWETLVTRTGAADNAVIIELARDVWEALGPNEYAVQLRHRPRTYWGFLEGRAWLNLGGLGLVALAIAAVEVQAQWGLRWWFWLPVMIAWPFGVLWLFHRRYRRRQRQGGKELPHL